MGYAICFSNCFSCNRIFGFNPNKVPAYNGQPICRDCVDKANPIRKTNGLALIDYDEETYAPIPEEELRS
jgi:hypothetical protein